MAQSAEQANARRPVPSATTGSATVARPRRTSADWTVAYASRLFYTDLLVIASTIIGYSLLAIQDVSREVEWADGPGIPYWIVLIIVGLGWLLALDAFDTRDRHTVGNGVIEYRRIVNATLTVFALFIGFAFFARMDLSRSLFFVALTIGLAFLLLSRWIWRQWLRRQQGNGSYVYRTVVIGDESKVRHVISSIHRTHGTGFAIVGAVTQPGGASSLLDVPVLGTYGETEKAMDAAGADTLIIAGADDLDPDTMRRLGWAMADRNNHLVVAPALTDVAGPRIHSRPAAGLPLVYVEFPTLDGYKRFVKRSFDIVTSSLLIVLASPLMIAAAIAVRADGPGPILYHQVRIGWKGRAFGMIKFRSMVADADDQLASLLDLQGTTDKPLFKVVDDPRITRVGRFLRKHSIDELPQLFNVFRGEMSLVGPRPHRLAEVELYDEAAHRRLLVKPGMSGLWQVSGRSSLAWEDALRLDLYYVENWSFTQDVLILFRTVRAVLAPGATAH